ncbi:MAG TPA: CGNR zinc finger domain-containing protein [Nocardioidaceae bacterium]|nr:CGNR zinc finger domain-containing protein [Nocardioidaceae bacterium]
MQLNPYGSDAVLLAAGLHRSLPRTPDELEAICRHYDVVIDRRATKADVRLVQSLVERWREVVDAATDQERADRLNVLLSEYAAYPRLSDHAGTGWHVHYRDPHVPLGRVVAALVTVGTTLHLAGRGMHRLGRCAADDCDQVIVDVSRNGRQRYCSPTCSNRDAVRRHRARRLETGAHR